MILKGRTESFGYKIHVALSLLWPALVAKLLEDSLTVEATRRTVSEYKEIGYPPEWIDAAVASAVCGFVLLVYF